MATFARRFPPPPSRRRSSPPPLAPANPPRWAVVTARDLMRTDLVTVDRSTPLSEVERVLVTDGITGVPVTDAKCEVVGVVSLRDLVQRHAENPDALPARTDAYAASIEALTEDFDGHVLDDGEEETAADVMTSEIVSVPADASLAEIARTMRRHRVHRVLVEQDGRYVGLIGAMEVFDAIRP